jgi:hypothetical protein
MKKQVPSKAEIATLLQVKAIEYEELAVQLEKPGTGIDKLLANAARGVAAKYAARAERMRSEAISRGEAGAAQQRVRDAQGAEVSNA